MRLRLTAAAAPILGLVLILGVAQVAAASNRTPPSAPPAFFGIAPQAPVSERDAEYMAAGGISTVRLPVPWSSVQPSRRGGYDWSGLDEGVATAARAGMRVLPFLYGTPR